MSGIKTRCAPIGGDIANQIRDAVARVASRQLNEREKASGKRYEEAMNHYDIHWKL